MKRKLRHSSPERQARRYDPCTARFHPGELVQMVSLISRCKRFIPDSGAPASGKVWTEWTTGGIHVEGHHWRHYNGRDTYWLWGPLRPGGRSIAASGDVAKAAYLLGGQLLGRPDER